jgi:hypothetical protein
MSLRVQNDRLIQMLTCVSDFQLLHNINLVSDGFWKNKRIVLFDTLLSPEMNEQLKALHNPQPTTDKKTDEIIDGDEKPEEVCFRLFDRLIFFNLGQR